MPATATWQRPLELLRSRTGVEAALVAVRSLSKPCSSTTARKRSDRARAGPQPSNDAMRCLKQALGLLSDTSVTSRKTLYTICESILDYLMAMGGDTAGLFVRASLSVVNHALDDGLYGVALTCLKRAHGGLPVATASADIRDDEDPALYYVSPDTALGSEFDDLMSYFVLLFKYQSKRQSHFVKDISVLHALVAPQGLLWWLEQGLDDSNLATKSKCTLLEKLLSRLGTSPNGQAKYMVIASQIGCLQKLGDVQAVSDNVTELFKRLVSMATSNTDLAVDVLSEVQSHAEWLKQRMNFDLLGVPELAYLYSIACEKAGDFEEGIVALTSVLCTSNTGMQIKIELQRYYCSLKSTENEAAAYDRMVDVLSSQHDTLVLDEDARSICQMVEKLRLFYSSDASKPFAEKELTLFRLMLEFSEDMCNKHIQLVSMCGKSWLINLSSFVVKQLQITKQVNCSRFGHQWILSIDACGRVFKKFSDNQRLSHVSNLAYRRFLTLETQGLAEKSLPLLATAIRYDVESDWESAIAKKMKLLSIIARGIGNFNATEAIVNVLLLYRSHRVRVKDFDANGKHSADLLSGICFTLSSVRSNVLKEILACKELSEISPFLAQIIYELGPRCVEYLGGVDEVIKASREQRSNAILCLAFASILCRCQNLESHHTEEISDWSMHSDSRLEALCLRFWLHIFQSFSSDQSDDATAVETIVQEIASLKVLKCRDLMPEEWHVIAKSMMLCSDFLALHCESEAAISLLSWLEACFKGRSKLHSQIRLRKQYHSNTAMLAFGGLKLENTQIEISTLADKVALRFSLAHAALAYEDALQCNSELQKLSGEIPKHESLSELRKLFGMSSSRFGLALGELYLLHSQCCFYQGNYSDALNQVEFGHSVMRKFVFTNEPGATVISVDGIEGLYGLGVWMRLLNFRGIILEHIGKARQAKYIYGQAIETASNFKLRKWHSHFKSLEVRLQIRCGELLTDMGVIEQLKTVHMSNAKFSILDALAVFYHAVGDFASEHEALIQMHRALNERRDKGLSKVKASELYSRRLVSVSSRLVICLCKSKKFEEARILYEEILNNTHGGLDSTTALMACRFSIEFVDDLLESDPALNGIRDSVISLPNFIVKDRSTLTTASRVSRRIAGPRRSKPDSSTSVKHLIEQMSRATLGQSIRDEVLNTLQMSQQLCANGFSGGSGVISTVELQDLALCLTDQTMLITALSLEEQQHSLAAAYFFEASKGLATEHHVLHKLGKARKDITESQTWPVTQLKHEVVPSFANVKEFQDFIATIPKDLLIYSIGVDSGGDCIIVSSMSADKEPAVFQLPVSRHSSRETDEESYSLEQALTELRDIVAASNESTKADGSTLSREAKRAWWANRKALDERMAELLDNIEYCWLGGLRSIFETEVVHKQAFQKFRTAMRRIIQRYLPKSNSSSTRRQESGIHGVAGMPEINPSLLEMFVRLKDPNGNRSCELIEDLLYFVFDMYQNHGVSIEYHEIDFDELAVDVKSALDAYHAQATSTRNSNESCDDDRRHIILILDKTLQEIPWESMSCLRRKPVSRLPSIFALRRCLSQPNQVSVRENVSYVLNPSRDLVETERVFAERLAQLPGTEEARAFVTRVPSEDELLALLRESSLFLYFGHSGGEQYARGSKLAGLSQCAVAIVMGCSSGALTNQGEFDPWGNAMDYMAAGCPCMVANLWDVTDRDIDKFSDAMLSKWGLWDGKQRGISIVQAVAQSRDVCKMRYLNGASPVVYGVPQWLAPRE